MAYIYLVNLTFTDWTRGVRIACSGLNAGAKIKCTVHAWNSVLDVQSVSIALLTEFSRPSNCGDEKAQTIFVVKPKGRSYFGYCDRDVKMYLTRLLGMDYTLRLRMGISSGIMWKRFQAHKWRDISWSHEWLPLSWEPCSIELGLLFNPLKNLVLYIPLV
jgi:hypothetical protein